MKERAIVKVTEVGTGRLIMEQETEAVAVVAVDEEEIVTAYWIRSDTGGACAVVDGLNAVTERVREAVKEIVKETVEKRRTERK